jgi:hypothetical protein
MKQIDIEQIKEEYEDKIKCAEISNSLAPMLTEEGIDLSVYAFNASEGKEINMVFRAEGSYSKSLTEKQVGFILSTFPQTDKIKVYYGLNDREEERNYALAGRKSWRESNTTLEIRYMSEGRRINIDFTLDSASEDILQFFNKNAHRNALQEVDALGKLSNSQRYHYENLPYISFGIGHLVRFQGGYEKQKDESAINLIVDKFKYLHEFATEE